MTVKVKAFTELTLQELYEIFFVVLLTLLYPMQKFLAVFPEKLIFRLRKE